MLAAKTQPGLAAKLEAFSQAPVTGVAGKRGKTMAAFLATLRPFPGCGTPGTPEGTRADTALAAIPAAYPPPRRTALADLRPLALAG